jgi:integrase
MAKKRLTAKFVEQVSPPADGRAEYIDTLLTGFALRVTPKGVKSWSVLYTRPGTGKVGRFTLGKFPAVSLASARELARKALQEVAYGRDPAEEKKAQRCGDTVAEVVREFINKWAKPRNRSWKDTERTLEREAIARWGSRSMASLRRADVLEVVDDLTAQGKGSMARGALAAIRKMCSWAVERGFIETNPAEGIRLATKTESRDRILTDNETRAVWDATFQLGYPFGDLYRFLMTTGQRLGEAASMTWEQVDGDLWTLPKESTKAGRMHEVPLSPLAMNILNDLPRFEGPFVFTTTGGEKPVSGFSKAKRRTDQASGVTEWRVHDLRRTAASGIARLGTAPHILSRVLNHSPTSTMGVTAVYNRHGYLSEKRQALECWAQHLEDLING